MILLKLDKLTNFRVPSSLPDELHSHHLQLKSQLSLFHHLFRCPTEEWEENQYRIKCKWNELEAQRLAQKASRATRRKRGKKGKRAKSKINNVVVCQIPNSTSCARVEHRDQGGNDKAHAELRSLESFQDFEDRKSCLSTEQVSFESVFDLFIIVEKSNTCFDEHPSALECYRSSIVGACV